MIRFFESANYDILRRRRLAYGIAIGFIVPGLILLAIRPLNLSIDFTGGTMIVVKTHDPAIRTGDIRSALVDHGVAGAEIKTFGQDNEFVIRARLEPGNETEGQSTDQTRRAVIDALDTAFGSSAYEVVLTSAVGPKVGGELRQKAIEALLMGFGVIFLYLWFRYEWRFGLAAVLATVHDIFSTLAFLSYLHLEISVFVVASLLLIVGYSLNDTIVTFDRVRENLRRFKRVKLYEILNRSINETLPRTILTSGTTLGASLALVLLGGEVLSAPLLVVTWGIVTGTFSSIFIASPILLTVERRWPGEDVRGAKDIGSGSSATVVKASSA